MLPGHIDHEDPRHHHFSLDSGEVCRLLGIIEGTRRRAELLLISDQIGVSPRFAPVV